MNKVLNLPVAVSLAPSLEAKGTTTTLGFCAWTDRLAPAMAAHIIGIKRDMFGIG
jgi:hypothetical protein